VTALPHPGTTPNLICLVQLWSSKGLLSMNCFLFTIMAKTCCLKPARGRIAIRCRLFPATTASSRGRPYYYYYSQGPAFTNVLSEVTM